MSIYDDLNKIIKLQAILERARISTFNQLGKIEGETEVKKVCAKVANVFVSLETEIESQAHTLVQKHPAWAWMEGVKGIGTQTACLLLSYLLPPREDKGPSSWYKASGLYTVTTKKGEVRMTRPEHINEDPFSKTIKGKNGKEVKILGYHPRMRRNMFVVGESLIKAGGFYYEFYLEAKDIYGIKHPDWKGRVHAVAFWKMVKLFLAHLYEAWSEEIGIEVREPYPIAILGHKKILRPYCKGRDNNYLPKDSRILREVAQKKKDRKAKLMKKLEEEMEKEEEAGDS